MPSQLERPSSQGLDSRIISLDAGEVAVVKFDKGPVQWTNGGVAWTIQPETAGESIEVAVEQSLLSDGDEDWTEDENSPFSETRQDAEFVRINRLRFSNAAASNTVTISVLCSAPFTVDLS